MSVMPQVSGSHNWKVMVPFSLTKYGKMSGSYLPGYQGRQVKIAVLYILQEL